MQIEKQLFRIGLVFCGAAVLLAPLFLHLAEAGSLQPCLFHTLTGYYCPGCGGSRAVMALLHGDFLRSFLYYPLIPYMVIFGTIFMVSHTLANLKVPHVKGLRWRNLYLWIGLGLVLVHWILINLGFEIFGA